MPANIDDLCDAVGGQLNGKIWTPTFTAVVDDTPIFSYEELEDHLHVTIIPFSMAWEEHTRADDKLIHTIEVHFQQKAAPPSTVPDPVSLLSIALRKLEIQVVHWLRKTENRKPPTYTEALLIDAHSKAPQQPVKSATEHRPLYDMELLNKKRTFWGVLRLTYIEYVRHDATI